MNTHFLIIGSGIAGLSLAVKLSEKFPDKKITIITKEKKEESNTQYAQGGIAVVQHNEDSFEKHIQDTIKAGDGLCDETVVETVIKNAPKRLQELIEWGSKFDKTDQKLNLGKEGGHSEHRIVHSKDQTGYEIEKTLINKIKTQKNIHTLEYHFAIDLITKNNTCYGAIVLNEKNNQKTTFIAQYTIIATGGIGRIYGHTTNPKIATADGIAMAHRAGAKIVEMEFVQFHPTALYNKNKPLEQTFLISEAVRGAGAHLKTKKGDRFMLKYHPQAELASRDIVSQSIHKELEISKENCVYLDCTHIDINNFKKHFPNIYKKCTDIGIDITKKWIPIIPAQHYICGGIQVNKHGETSIKNLLACGECTRTGLHGANRLASNSLLEALVYADAIFQKITTMPNQTTTLNPIIINNPINQPNQTTIPETIIQKNIQLLQHTMHKYAGIVRTNKDLNHAKETITEIQKAITEKIIKYQPTKIAYELKNMADVALIIINQSLQRTENKGGFIKI